MSSRIQRKDRKYKDLSAKQKTRIAEKTYRAYLSFYLEHERMPDDEEATSIHRKEFQSVTALAPNALYEEFEEICQNRALRYVDRIPADISRGVTLESLHKPKKTPAEKATIQKAKNEARRKRRKKRNLKLLALWKWNKMIRFSSSQDIPPAVHLMVLRGNRWAWFMTWRTDKVTGRNPF